MSIEAFSTDSWKCRMQALKWSMSEGMVTPDQYAALQTRLLEELTGVTSLAPSSSRDPSQTPSHHNSSFSRKRAQCSDVESSGSDGEANDASGIDTSKEGDEARVRSKSRRMKARTSIEEKMTEKCKTIVMVEVDGKLKKREIPFIFETKEGVKIPTWKSDADGLWTCNICSNGKLPVFNPDPSAKQRLMSKLEHNTYMDHTNAIIKVWKPPEGVRAIKWMQGVGKQSWYFAKAHEHLSTGVLCPPCSY